MDEIYGYLLSTRNTKLCNYSVIKLGVSVNIYHSVIAND